MDATVDPTNIPTKLTRVQLEDWLVFSICVANKEASQTRKKVDLFFSELRYAYPALYTPFAIIRAAVKDGKLRGYLEMIRTGQYNRIERALTELIEVNLDTVSVESLEAVHGIGPKTARMAMLYYLPGLEVVPLDTHVLKYLRKLGYEDAPKATPSAGKSYQKWEAIFVAEAKKAGKTVREFDTMVWQMYAKSLNGTNGTRG